MGSVSIHAPARGATTSDKRRFPNPRSFNPRARTGRDMERGCSPQMEHLFQSTRPHGARLPAILRILRTGLVSIHAPARGATLFGASRRANISVSIHAPARGATVDGACADSLRSRFNPRARTGRDASPSAIREVEILFQSTRPHGARPQSRI